jgi:hypothetical protein
VGWIDSKTTALPLGRREDLLIENVGDESVVYDLESKNVHCLSPLAAVVFEHCDGRTKPADCASIAADRLGRDVSEDEVLAAVGQLEERELFFSPVLKLNGNGNGISRRDFARRGAVAGAVAFAAPLITSIAAPTAAMAASGIASGCAGCGKNPDCVSNHCCQSNAGKSCNQGCCVDHDNSCHFCNCLNNKCDCTVAASDIPGGCPCVCGTAGCVNVPCCPTINLVCCTPTAAC